MRGLGIIDFIWDNGIISKLNTFVKVSFTDLLKNKLQNGLKWIFFWEMKKQNVVLT